eukprot:TRINITY_DN834_c0_g1_i1.p1 TRINITY_DN834_c0_g1~~TRINITY_DN834_c0_g1_i1.p1  ORF type:complete len:403 (+),score=115.41 TRINITY_DN834_c0_g1_i1:107-1315(+)
MPQVLLRVYLMDDSHKTVYVDPEHTTMEQLWVQVSQKLNLSEASAECFFLWQVSKDMELLLFVDQTIQEAYDEWANVSRRWGAKRTITSAVLETVGKGAVGKLEKSPTGVLVQSPSSSGRAKIRRGDSKYIAAESVPGLADGDVADFKFVYRPTAVLPLEVEKALSQTEAVHLIYIQSVHHVIHSNYPSLVDTALVLAGVQIQIQLGDYKLEHDTHILDAVDKYIPQHLIDTRKPEEWARDLIIQHRTHHGKDPVQLKRAYITVCQQWPFYGCTFFNVKGVPSQTNHSFFKQEYQGPLVFGINHSGIHIIEPKEMKYETWGYRELVYWDAMPSMFVFQVKTESKKDPLKSFNFKTKQAGLINGMMSDWAEEWGKRVKENAPGITNEQVKALNATHVPPRKKK